MLHIKKKKLQPNLASEKGYTLIEILISVAIFAIGILAIAGLQVRATSTDTHSRLLTDAYMVATDQIEALMLMPYTDSEVSSGRHPATGHISAGPSGRDLMWYQVTDNNPINNCKSIQVFVRINSSGIGFTDAPNQAHVRIDYIKPRTQDLES